MTKLHSRWEIPRQCIQESRKPRDVTLKERWKLIRNETEPLSQRWDHPGQVRQRFRRDLQPLAMGDSLAGLKDETKALRSGVSPGVQGLLGRHAVEGRIDLNRTEP